MALSLSAAQLQRELRCFLIRQVLSYRRPGPLKQDTAMRPLLSIIDFENSGNKFQDNTKVMSKYKFIMYLSCPHTPN